MKTIQIVAVINAVGALATENLNGSIYFVDSNKLGGSTGQGTEALSTAVRKGDELLWTSQTLDVEAFAAIVAIDIDRAYCEPRRRTYEGTDIIYWIGTVKKDPDDAVISYNMKVRLGSREEDMSMSEPNLSLHQRREVCVTAANRN